MKLKNIFSTIFFAIAGVVFLNAQEFIANSLSSDLKIGIYKNFEEFKNNSPSIKLEYQVLEAQKKTAGIFDGMKTTFFYLDISKEAAKKIGKVYGFCDGKNIFINEFKPRLKSTVLFMRVGFVENYCIFEYKTFNGLDSLLPNNKVIDMQTGRSKILSIKALKNFAANRTNIATHTDSLKIVSVSDN